MKELRMPIAKLCVVLTISLALGVASAQQHVPTPTQVESERIDTPLHEPSVAANAGSDLIRNYVGAVRFDAAGNIESAQLQGREVRFLMNRGAFLGIEIGNKRYLVQQVKSAASGDVPSVVLVDVDTK
jgi:hypothetical protein